MPDPASGSAPCEVRAEVLRRNWAIPITAIAIAIAGVVAGRAPPSAALVGWVISLVAIVFAVGTITRSAFPRARPVVLRASRVELVLGEDAPIAVDRIAEARLDAIGATHATMTVTLREGGRRWLRMATHDAMAVLSALGIAAGARRATFALMIPFAWRFVASFLVFVAPWMIAALLRGRVDVSMTLVGGLCLAAPTAAIAWLAGMWRGRLVIAADGITVRWFFRERFIAFADMTVLRAAERWGASSADTSIELRSGRRLRLRARDVPVTGDQVGAEARALHAQMVAAFDSAKRRTTESQNVAALLASDGRSGAQWLAHLDGVMGGVARYRVAAPAPAVLSTIANDPTSGTETRAAAAAVLARIDDAGRHAVRIAADACAEPVLREALVSISEAESDEAFASALERARKR